MPNSFHGANHVIRAASIVEQRPSGRHVELWQVRVEIDPETLCYKVYCGGNDPFAYTQEADAVEHFDRAARRN